MFVIAIVFRITKQPLRLKKNVDYYFFFFAFIKSKFKILQIMNNLIIDYDSNVDTL